MTKPNSTLRDVSGRFWICVASIVEDTDVDCVWTRSVVALTSTVSLRLPISSFALTLPGEPATRTTSLITTVLNPDSDTVTE